MTTPTETIKELRKALSLIRKITIFEQRDEKRTEVYAKIKQAISCWKDELEFLSSFQNYVGIFEDELNNRIQELKKSIIKAKEMLK